MNSRLSSFSGVELFSQIISLKLQISNEFVLADLPSMLKSITVFLSLGNHGRGGLGRDKKASGCFGRFTSGFCSRRNHFDFMRGRCTSSVDGLRGGWKCGGDVDNNSS